jgi:hypothetical protein
MGPETHMTHVLTRGESLGLDEPVSEGGGGGRERKLECLTDLKMKTGQRFCKPRKVKGAEKRKRHLSAG